MTTRTIISLIRDGRVHRPLAYLLSATFLTGVAYSQTQVNAGTDDYALLHGYLGLHLAIEQAAEQDSSLRHSAALMIGITDADFAMVTIVARSRGRNCATSHPRKQRPYGAVVRPKAPEI
jgi:hypothetical protein